MSVKSGKSALYGLCKTDPHQSGRRRHAAVFAAVLAAGSAADLARGQIFLSWTFAGAGSWGTATNWQPNTVPNAAGVIAQFGTPGAPTTVTQDFVAGVTLDGIQFNGASTTNTFTIIGNAITLTGAASINVAGSNLATINSNLTTAGTLTKVGTGTLVLGGTNSMAALTLASGVITVGSATALPGNLPLTLGSVSTATLQLGANPATFASITMPYNSAGTTSGGITGSNLITLDGDLTYTPNYGSGGSSPLVITGGSVSLSAGTHTFNIAYNANLSGDVQLTSPVTGTGAIVKTGTGSLALSHASGTFSGGVDVQAGALILGADATGTPGAVTAGPAGTGAITVGSFAALRGSVTGRVLINSVNATGDFLMGSLTINSPISVPATGRGMSFASSSATAGTINGAISGTGSASMFFGNLAAGTGTITASQAYAFPTVLNSGTLNLATASGVLSGTSAVTINSGTLNVVTGTSANRFNDAATFNLNGGSLVFSGSVAAGGYIEVMGDLEFAAASGFIGLTSSSTSAIARLTFTDVRRANRATGAIAGTNLGQNDSFSTALPSVTTAYVKIATAANETALVGSLIGGGAAYNGTNDNNSIVPWMVGATSNTTPTTFLTYAGTGGTAGGNTGAGFIALAPGAFDTIVPTANVQNNVRLTTTSAGVNATATVNSLLLAGGSLTGSGVVDVTSGAVMATSTGTITTGIRGGTGTQELVMSQWGVTHNQAGSLQTSGGLTKFGTGTLILLADNSAGLSGGIVVNQGTLQYSADGQLGSAANPIALYQNAALFFNSATDVSTGRAVTIGNTNVAGNLTPLAGNALLSQIAVATGGTLTFTTPIAGTGAGGFVKTGAGTLVTGIASSVQGLTAVRGGTLSLTGNNAAAPGSIEVGSGGALRVTAGNNLTGGSVVLAGGTLVVAGSDTYARGVGLHSIGASSSVGTIDVGSGLTGTFSGNFTTSGVPGLAKVGTLNKIGAGTLTFTGAHTAQTGTYNVAAGNMVFAGANGAAAQVGIFSVASSAKLVLDNTTTNANRLPNDAAITVASSSELLYRGGAAANAEAMGTLVLSGSGTVTADASAGGNIFLDFARLTLSGTSNLFRGTNLGGNSGVFTRIRFTDLTGIPTFGTPISGALYDGDPTGNGLGVTGGLLTYNPASDGFGVIGLSILTATDYVWIGGGSPPNWADATAGWYVGTPANPQNWTSGGLSNATIGRGSDTAGSITIGSAGVSANVVTFNPPGSGTYTVSGGTLTVGGGVIANESAAVAGTLTMSASQAITVASSKTLTVSTLNETGGARALTKAGAGTLVLSGGLAHTGTTTLSAGTLDVTVAAGSNTATMSGGGSGSLVKRGAGTLTLLGTSTRTGDTLVNGGTLAVDSAGAIGGGANVFVNAGATLRLGTSVNNSSTPAGTISVSDGTLAVPSGSSDYHANRLEFTGGTFTLVGSSNFWFHMKQAVGSATVPSIQVFPSAAGTVWAGVSGGSRLQNDHSAAIDINVGNGPSAVDLDVPSLVLSSGGTTNTFNKTGAGTMRTGAANTASFNVNEGLMLVNGSGNTGAYTVSMPATLGGSGAISGAVTVNASGNLSPGNGGIGTLSTGSLTLSAGANFLVEADLDLTGGTSADVVNVTGTVAVGGANLVFTFVPAVGGPITPNQTYVVVRNDATDGVTGTFANAPVDDAVNTLGALKYVVDYNYSGTDNQGFLGSGNDIAVTFVEVPEPTAAGLVAVAGAGLLRRRRRPTRG